MEIILNKNNQETETKKTAKSKVSSPIRKKNVSNPIKRDLVNAPAPEISMTSAIEQEANNIVARINNFNEKNNKNRLYGGFMSNPHAAAHNNAIDYSELMSELNSELKNKNTVHDLVSAVHKVFAEKIKNVYTAFGIFHEKSKCINLKLFNQMGSTYSSKIFLSDDKNPVVECFTTSEPVIKSDNKFLNIPYLPNSQALIMPLVSLNNPKGVMIIGKDNADTHLGLFSLLSNYCAMFMDNIELKEKAGKYANTDNLTGLYNHRGFQELLSSELQRAEANNSQLSIIMFDVNNISKINRELGHAKGDEVIKLLAEKIKQNIRSNDNAGRYGGDEIAVILPETNTADAKYLAEYITYTLSCCFVDDVGPVKVSVGISTYPECTRDQEKLLILAEQAMYISQAKGYKEGMSAIISSSDFNFWDDAALNSFAEVVAKRHAQLGINFEEELVHKFNNEQIISQNHLMEMVTSLAGAIDAKDPYTKGHSTSVSRYSEALARAINLPEDEVQRIKLGALLHDVGKIGIPENVLKKPTHLSDDEWEIMKQHPTIGAEKVLAPNEALRDLIPMVKYHHEHIDGSGYPDKLKGEEIPLSARIVAVADAFHALISDRPYRKGLGVEKACEILKMGAGTQWDSDLVRHFIAIAPSLSTMI